jgi:hypothetical protein
VPPHGSAICCQDFPPSVKRKMTVCASRINLSWRVSQTLGCIYQYVSVLAARFFPRRVLRQDHRTLSVAITTAKVRRS